MAEPALWAVGGLLTGLLWERYTARVLREIPGGAAVPARREHLLTVGLHALAWLLAARLRGAGALTCLGLCLLSSALLTVARIDRRTFTIPNSLNLTILALAALRMTTEPAHRPDALLGMASAGGSFLLLWLATRGEGLGLGDVKLMAAAGLYLGWMDALLALTAASVTGTVIHGLRMTRGAGSKLAFGPYLAFGVWAAALWGQRLWSAWLGLFF